MNVSFPKPLTEKEEKYYIAEYENGNEEAKQILIERNLRLVAHIAKKYTSNSHIFDDYVSIGTIGLIKAVNSYSSDKSTRLATYAARCIENEILMVIRSSKKNAAEMSLSASIGTDKDGNDISLDDILGTDPDIVFDDINLKIQVQEMYNIMKEVLTTREQQVLIHRYGLYGAKPEPQREVAKHLNISRSYVSRIEKKALEKMRAFIIK